MDTAHQITLQSMISFGIVWLIQKMKGSSLGIFRRVSEANPAMLRAMSAIAALLVGAGFTYEWHSVAADDSFQLIIGIPGVEQVADTILSVGWSMLNQEVQYQSLFKKS